MPVKNKFSAIKFCFVDTSEHKNGGVQDYMLHLQSFYWAEKYKLLTQSTLLLQQLPLPYIRSSPISISEFSRKMKASVMPLCLPNAILLFSTHHPGKAVEQQTDNAVIWGKFQLSLLRNINATSWNYESTKYVDAHFGRIVWHTSFLLQKQDPAACMSELQQ